MKKWLVFGLFLCFVGMVSATISVHNFSVKDRYYSLEAFGGTVNLSIEEEDYDKLVTSNNGDSMMLGDFLNAGDSLFSCFPADCSSSYSFSQEESVKRVDIPLSGKKYVGFVLEGEDVVLSDMIFGITSDFPEGSRCPLTIKLFEGYNWKFDKFSESSFLDKNWGCYDFSAGGIGPTIGKTLYCEEIYLSDSEKLFVGALVNRSGSGNLTMTVREAGFEVSKCSYNPYSSEGCLVAVENGIFSSGNYQICVNSNVSTSYRIYNESVGETCGAVGSNEEILKDYSIFAQGIKYASSDSLKFFNFSDDDFVQIADSYIEEKYDRDCSDGCVLPLEFSGVPQGLMIYGASLNYANPEEALTDKIYELNASPAKVDFEGTIDLGALNFLVSKSMNYSISIGNFNILKKMIVVIPKPFVVSASPLNPPAGVPVEFYLETKFDSSDSLTYIWDFGDGSGIETTSVPVVSHSYSEIMDYVLSVRVSAGGNLSSTKSFDIKTISPVFAVETELDLKKSALNKIKSSIGSSSFWYKNKLSEYLKIDFFVDELGKIDVRRNVSVSDEDFVSIAKDLYALNIPRNIGFNNIKGYFFMTKPEEVNVDLIRSFGGDGDGSNDDYVNGILSWQNENIDVSFSKSEVNALLWNGKMDSDFEFYSFELKSKSDVESYFVINRLPSDLYFRRDVGASAKDVYSVITIAPNSKKTFEFYYEGGEPISFFVSPKLNSIILGSDIDLSCNYNLVCEKELGENSESCRSDCRPIIRAIIYSILVFFLFLVLYSVMQIWYKRHYENFLFKDRKHLYNLLMFVTNARARGMNDYRIGAELRAQGWSSERVNYIIKKSKGERTGLYEIIPFEKIMAYFRNRRAVKMEANRVATAFQQQEGRNINKSRFQTR